ncbi:hypothetical protein D3C71_1199520 [compost metagenome]
MLQRVKELPDDIMNIIIYTTSARLTVFIRNMLKTKFEVHKDYIVDTETERELKAAKLDSYASPLFCDKWLIHVNADKLSKKDLFTNLAFNTHRGITVYWTEKYKIYRQLIDSDVVKKQSVYCAKFPFNRLTERDVTFLHMEMVKESHRLDNKLLEFVKENYLYDVNAVTELFAEMNSGGRKETKAEIIEEVGIGGNSPATVLMKALRFGIVESQLKDKPPSTKPSSKTRKQKKPLTREEKIIAIKRRAFNGIVRHLKDLRISLPYSSIYNFTLNSLDAFIDMKQLQLLGIYGRPFKKIPEKYDSKRIDMNKRYSNFILNDVSLDKLLILKQYFLKYDSFDDELNLLRVFLDYIASVEVREG